MNALDFRHYFFQWAADSVAVPAVPVQGSTFGGAEDWSATDTGDWAVPSAAGGAVQQPAPAQPQQAAKPSTNWGSAPAENWS